MGVSLADIESAPAHLCDWLLAIDGTVNEIEDERARRSGNSADTGTGDRRVTRVNNRERERE